ncbi:hypothetical protein EYF80_018237 [Liparis tanakae]|uniref:Uncharacterized protein n=1 Tax=Liparis tanakae TaxID=230148 RepID=A0A4Z2I157_9TELE|nr:hypothetical protein EYF80_018237 [Liparis tanakae]
MTHESGSVESSGPRGGSMISTTDSNHEKMTHLTIGTAGYSSCKQDYAMETASSCCSSAEISSAIIVITLGTLVPRRANAPREVGILSLSAAHSHTEDFLQTTWTDSCDGKEKGKV